MRPLHPGSLSLLSTLRFTEPRKRAQLHANNPSCRPPFDLPAHLSVCVHFLRPNDKEKLTMQTHQHHNTQQLRSQSVNSHRPSHPKVPPRSRHTLQQHKIISVLDPIAPVAVIPRAQPRTPDPPPSAHDSATLR